MTTPSPHPAHPRSGRPPIAIVGAGIGGLVLALELDRAGIPFTLYEGAPELRPLGVGINLLPHATEVLAGIGVLDRLLDIAVETKESVFYNRFGQQVYREPAGRFAGAAWPQLSIHRGDLQTVLAEVLRERAGAQVITLDSMLTGFEPDGDAVVPRFQRSTGASVTGPRAAALIGADGVHSAVRRQLYPAEGAPSPSGVVMWRGVTVAPPFLSGASMVRAGWLDGGKMVIYPIKDDVDGAGNQLVNWVAEIRTDLDLDIASGVDPAEYLPAFADWDFPWLNVPDLLRRAQQVLRYPMVDREPLPRWTFDRVTLLGDAAHPMVPRGSNGAGQAILDAGALARTLRQESDPAVALARYEQDRLPATSAVVLANRQTPPDAILREVWQRTNDTPFDRVEDVISEQEMRGILDGYRAITQPAGETR
jgi:2-polyprenyl-6-methoxyphenol hydroxylase-like FAD-dependent oxidoreductase